MKTLVLLLFFVQVAAGQVSYERIRRADAEPGNWLTYSGNYQGYRYSALDQIKTASVRGLKPIWIYQSRGVGLFQASPIVVDGMVYISERPCVVTALDGRTGRPLWSFRREMPADIRACCGGPNRGLAILDGTLFLGTLDSHLIALDVRTGRVQWDAVVADYRSGYAITVAPLAIKDKVIVGVAGGEYGIRGFLDAYDAKTGKRAWRFWTVPGPGEPGHETWEGESWKTGGAPTWVTGSYDPELNLIYWGTGNPGPDYDGEERKGINLYSNSLLALDADTGSLKWYFQFTPHDVHDWDANHVSVLIDDIVKGRPRKLVVQANRNAFYYVLDRETGEFLSGVPYAKQTWAQGLGARGAPIHLPNTLPSHEGAVVYPGLTGGTNWYSPSYSPLTGLFYVAAREEGTVFFKAKQEYKIGEWFTSGGTRGIAGIEPFGAVRALEAKTGKLRWEFRLHSPPWGGLLSTAGGLVFGGSSEGDFFALDARSGEPLWRFQTGGPVWANPISFLIDRRQHVAIAAGQSLLVFGLD